MLSGAIWFALGQVLAMAVEPWTHYAGLGERYTAQFAPIFLNGTLLFLLAAAAHYLLIAVDESRAVEKRSLELQVLAREAELKALRAQIDPHFLFNSLNSISALTVADPAGARRMCLLLADFLRSSLVLGAKQQIPVADELRLVESFLDIEKVRYGQRLAVSREVDPACGAYLVPPLLIQPLMENAIRHGIARLVDGGTVHISVQREGRSLKIAVENPVDPIEGSERNGAGVGLENVRARLSRVFANQASMDVLREDGMFRVLLRIPCIQHGDKQ
jgi:LytS/YehU family sensor histidine kinase